MANKEFTEVAEALDNCDKALKQFAEATVVAINDFINNLTEFLNKTEDPVQQIAEINASNLPWYTKRAMIGQIKEKYGI